MLPLGMTMGLGMRVGSSPAVPWYDTLAGKISQLLLSGSNYQTESGGLISSWSNYAATHAATATGTARPTQNVGANGAYYASFNGATNVLEGAMPITAVAMLALVRINSGIEMFGDGVKRLGPIWFPTVADLLPTDANSLLNVGTNYANGTATNVWWPGGWGVIGQVRDNGIAVTSAGVLKIGSAFGTFSNCDIATAVWFHSMWTPDELDLATAQMLAGAPTEFSATVTGGALSATVTDTSTAGFANYGVSWGDGSDNTTDKMPGSTAGHDYDTPGVYTVTVSWFGAEEVLLHSKSYSVTVDP